MPVHKHTKSEKLQENNTGSSIKPKRDCTSCSSLNAWSFALEQGMSQSRPDG